MLLHLTRRWLVSGQDSGLLSIGAFRSPTVLASVLVPIPLVVIVIIPAAKVVVHLVD